jgi:hypothetical protein
MQEDYQDIMEEGKRVTRHLDLVELIYQGKPTITISMKDCNLFDKLELCYAILRGWKNDKVAHKAAKACPERTE